MLGERVTPRKRELRVDSPFTNARENKLGTGGGAEQLRGLHSPEQTERRARGDIDERRRRARVGDPSVWSAGAVRRRSAARGPGTLASRLCEGPRRVTGSNRQRAPRPAPGAAALPADAQRPGGLLSVPGPCVARADPAALRAATVTRAWDPHRGESPPRCAGVVGTKKRGSRSDARSWLFSHTARERRARGGAPNQQPLGSAPTTNIGRSPDAFASGGKSELHRTGCRLTAGGGNPEDSATENRPPAPCSHAAGKGETVR